MRVHFSSIVTILLALLLVSGTVGCRSNGGPWYNPTTYSFASPSGKGRPASPYSSSVANQKPSLDAQPNISAPHGGYTDNASFAASPASSGGTVSNTPPAHWAQHNPVPQQNVPNSYSSYTVADPSQYSPQTYTEAYGGQSVPAPTSTYPYVATQGQQSPYQYSPEPVQQAHSYPAMPYGEQQHAQTAYQTTSAYQQQPMYNAPVGTFGAANQPSQYGSQGTMPPNDPYAGMQQPSTVPPSGFGQEQPVSPSYAYPSEGVSVAFPYQSYQPPVASGTHSY